MVDITMYLLNI